MQLRIRAPQPGPSAGTATEGRPEGRNGVRGQENTLNDVTSLVAFVLGFLVRVRVW